MSGTKQLLRGSQHRIHDSPIRYPDWWEFWSGKDGFLTQKPASFNRKAFCNAIGVSLSTLSKWAAGLQLPRGENVNALVESGGLSYEQIQVVKEIYFAALGLSDETIERFCSGMSEQHATCDKMLDALDKEFFALARSGSAVVEEAQFNRLIEDVFADICDLFEPPANQQRVAIYLPDRADPNYATISGWHTGLPPWSLRNNRPYIGPDPVPIGSKRGTVGHVWRSGKGLFIPDVDTDGPTNRYADFYEANPRPVPCPYISLVGSDWLSC